MYNFVLSQYAVLRMQYSVHQYAVRRTPYAVRRTPYAVRRTQYAVRSTQYAVRSTQYAAVVRHECRSVNRNCCLEIWNLYLVFQFPNRRARRVLWILHAWRYLDLEICPVSKIRGEARNLDSGWPEPVLGNCPVIQNPWRGAESGIWGIWMARAAFLETRVLPKSGQPPAPALSLTVQCVRLPRCF